MAVVIVVDIVVLVLWLVIVVVETRVDTERCLRVTIGRGKPELDLRFEVPRPSTSADSETLRQDKAKLLCDRRMGCQSVTSHRYSHFFAYEALSPSTPE
ncbi:hypothetical protein Hypma_005625 [Hypsizygus marmoreus]|uniref:Uncharacterized protein n=1 Tax=Hypsizygus marmoreus TaxID=39966 RepID=A0A369K6H8_HYPMA|nr:hypothetical protein Hypma_005625 [Hypsizygus marmoreus]